MNHHPIPYHTEEYGRGPEPWLMLHGFTGRGSNWSAVAQAMGARYLPLPHADARQVSRLVTQALGS